MAKPVMKIIEQEIWAAKPELTDAVHERRARLCVNMLRSVPT